MRKFIIITFALYGIGVASQNTSEGIVQDTLGEPISQSKFVKTPLIKARTAADSLGITIEDYKIIAYDNSTIHLDTTLTIQKQYDFNYLRSDNFELLPFSNIGQAYNKLGVDFEQRGVFPLLGATAKMFHHKRIEDITYYNVPTPMSDLMFKTTLKEGQLLNVLLTANTSENFNFSIAYKGHRSLGKYNFNQIQSGNFITTTNYTSPNKQYRVRAHIAAQDITSEENGGLINKELQFESKDDNFTDRSKVDVRFLDARNKILSKRYYFDNQLKIAEAGGKDRKTAILLDYSFNYETKYYQYTQASSSDYFGSSFSAGIDDKSYLKTFNNELGVTFKNNQLGQLRGSLLKYDYNYYFRKALTTANGKVLKNQLRGTEYVVGASYNKRIRSLQVSGDLKYGLSNELTGLLVNGIVDYTYNKDNSVKLKLNRSARLPNFNFLLQQSDYEDYNWQNEGEFDKEQATSIEAQWNTKPIGAFSAKYTSLKNYTYFGSDELKERSNFGEGFIRPLQARNVISYIKLKYHKEITVGKFSLDNTIMYQSANAAKGVFNIPEFTTRNTLYYTANVFKGAMYLQTGFTFKYFMSYYMDDYNPLLGEFVVQGVTQLGGYPVLDCFIVGKIKQTRIYLQLDHINSMFGKADYYVAPGYPYRDSVLRFGLVWNFFS